MIRTHAYGKTHWIELEAPTPAEINEAITLTGADVGISEDLLNPSLKHRIEYTEHHAYLVFHFPAFKDSTSDDSAFELDFVIGKNYIITTYYKPIDLFKEARGLIEVTGDPSEIRNSILFSILDSLLANFERKLTEVDHWIRAVERNLFAGKEKQTIFELSEATRHLIDFKNITAVYPEIFTSLVTQGEELFGKDFARLAAAASERFEKDAAKLAALLETAHELRETNNAILSTRQNETMKVLTIVFIVSSALMGAVLAWIELSN
jgi:Mg2+ and Co2+ transporter CorA